MSPRMRRKGGNTANESQKNSISALAEGKVQRLVDLVNSDFEMHPKDKDYRLSHD